MSDLKTYEKYLKQVTVNLPNWAYDALDKIKEEYGIPKAYFSREAILDALSKTKFNPDFNRDKD
jgi:predicted DNA-binding protein